MDFDYSSTRAFSRCSSSKITPFEFTQAIDTFLISEDQSTIVCSFYSQYLAVISLVKERHTTTLKDPNSLLLLYSVCFSKHFKIQKRGVVNFKKLKISNRVGMT